MKVCTKCKKEKEDTEFFRDNRASTGRASACKLCASTWKSEHAIKFICDWCKKEATKNPDQFRGQNFHFCSNDCYTQHKRVRPPKPRPDIAGSKNNHFKHGMSSTSIHKLWRGLHNRCYRKDNAQYSYYGGRGIKVCERWHDFMNFYHDMGDRPKGKTLDRIDSNGDYSPENCKWSTHKEQQRNRRNNIYVQIDGNPKLLIEWCEENNVNYATIATRIRTYGWSLERAIATPIKKI